MGGCKADIPRCGVANLHTDDDSDNLLVNNFLKYYDYGKDNEIKQLCNRSNAADVTGALHRWTDVRNQNG